MGRGSEVGAALLQDPGVAAITFTGSVATGQKVAAACVARMAKFQLEMGGKNPIVVLDDADLVVAVGTARRNSGFFSTGQRCTASSRVIVTDGIHDKLRGCDGRTHEDAEASTTRARPAPTSARWSTPSSLRRTMDYIDIASGKKAPRWPGGEARQPQRRRRSRASTCGRPCSPAPRRPCASTAKRSSARW